jgi:hypothetical protein
MDILPACTSPIKQGRQEKEGEKLDQILFRNPKACCEEYEARKKRPIDYGREIDL